MVHSRNEEAYTPVLGWRKWTVYQAGRKKGKQDERKVQANAVLLWDYRADLLTVLAKCMNLAMQICNDNCRAELGWKLPYPLVQDQLRPFLENIGQQNACLICKTTILKKCYNVLHFYMQIIPINTPSSATIVFWQTSLIHIHCTILVLLKEHKQNCIYERN